MANTPQSKKRARQNERRYAVNKARRSRIRTFLRNVEEAIASGDQEAAVAALRAAQPELMRGVTKGVHAQEHGVAENVPAVVSREGPQRLILRHSTSKNGRSIPARPFFCFCANG